MKTLLKLIISAVLMLSTVIVLAMTVIITEGIWHGDISRINILLFTGGIIAATSLITHALEAAFSVNDKKK